MSPQRIQRKRESGWRMPENAVYVGRPSKWGNPFRVGKPIPAEYRSYFAGIRLHDAPLWRAGVVEDREHAVALWWSWVLGYVPFTQDEVRRGLAGKDLACWCPLPKNGEPDHCHAAALLSIANEGNRPL